VPKQKSLIKVASTHKGDSVYFETLVKISLVFLQIWSIMIQMLYYML